MFSQGKYNLQRCPDGLVGDQWGVVPGFQLQVFLLVNIKFVKLLRIITITEKTFAYNL